MTNSFHAQQGYKTAQRELTSFKGIELKVFSKVTSALKSVDVEELNGMVKLAPALVDNAKLWSILLVDMLNPENELPQSLKNSLISLAEFTQKHTLKVLAGEADHSVLVDINESIIAGLRQSADFVAGQKILQTEAA